MSTSCPVPPPAPRKATSRRRPTSRMSEAPLYVDDSANITISEIRSKCRRLKQQENLGLVVIDYLQLMTSGRQVESRQ